MQKIRGINDDIHKLAQGSLQSVTECKRLASKKELFVIQNFSKRVRDGAQSIYNSLRSGILTPHSCGDHGHSISLCLEIRDAAGSVLPKLKPRCDPSGPALYFRIVLSLAESKLDPGESSTHLVPRWKELEVEPIVNVGSMGTDEDGLDENEHPQDDMCGNKSIPTIHLDNLDINLLGAFPGNMRQGDYTHGNADLEQPTSNTNMYAGQAHAFSQRPATPTRQVRFSL